MNVLQPERLQALARDYALGTLAGGARRRFERVMREHAQAEQAMLDWQARFATLAPSVPPLQPRPEVWQRLRQRIAPAPEKTANRWWAWLSGRGLGAALGGVLAGALIAVVVLREQPAWVGLEPAQQGLPASYVGLLNDRDGKPGLLASSRRHGRQITVKLLQPLPVPPGRVAVLWALPKDGGKPFVVGTVPSTGSATLPLPDTAEKLFFPVSRLGIVLESSATPTQPGGEFIWSGNCVKLW